MKMLVLVLASLFLLSGVSGCVSNDTKPVFIYETEYIYPDVPAELYFDPPDKDSVTLWGHHKVYRLKCEAAIASCNSHIKSIYESLEGAKDVSRDTQKP